MAESVNLPGAGPVKKTWVMAGGAVLAGILAVAYYRHARNKAAPAADSPAQPDPNAVDPNTGLTYGEEAAGIESGTVAGGGTPYGDTSGLVGYDARGNPIYSDAVGYGPAPSFVNNQSWAQAAEQYLVSTTGADAGTVAAALGVYLNGQPLTQAQASIVQQSIGFFGQPPAQGSNGYPPSLRMAEPQTGGTGGSTTPPPAPAPTPSPSATLAPPSGIRATRVTKNSITVAWNKVPGATGYTGHVTYQENRPGAYVSPKQTTSGTSMTFSGLGANHTYTIHLATTSHAGTGSATDGPAIKTSR